MNNELPWSERVNIFSVNPDAATMKDIARMATELSQWQHFEKMVMVVMKIWAECRKMDTTG